MARKMKLLVKKVFDGVYEIGNYIAHRETEEMKYRKWNKSKWVLYKNRKRIDVFDSLDDARRYAQKER
jgi:hypothetical protein